jgi:Flp pilus assembly pilin Flp
VIGTFDERASAASSNLMTSGERVMCPSPRLMIVGGARSSTVPITWAQPFQMMGPSRTDSAVRHPEGTSQMLNLLTILIDRLTARLHNDEGAVAIEYVLLAGVGALGIIFGIAVLFPTVGGFFQDIADEVGAALGS